MTPARWIGRENTSILHIGESEARHPNPENNVEAPILIVQQWGVGISLLQMERDEALLFYTFMGTGPDVVLVHPTPVHHAFWLPVAERLADRLAERPAPLLVLSSSIVSPSSVRTA